MTAANFPTFFEFIERAEFDGQPLHTTFGDKGGATSWGWTYRTWVGFANLHGADASFSHFKAMARDDFIRPTRTAFWNGVLADQLPAGIDVLWADFQFGSHWATRELQTVLGVEADNAVGPITVGAAIDAANDDAAGLLDRLTDARHRYYETLDDFARFGRGWDHRADECHILATKLITTAISEADQLNADELARLGNPTQPGDEDA